MPLLWNVELEQDKYVATLHCFSKVIAALTFPYNTSESVWVCNTPHQPFHSKTSQSAATLSSYYTAHLRG